MSLNTTPNSPDNQEIDLSQVSKSIGNLLDKIANLIYTFFLFIKRNVIALAILFIFGLVLGYFLDKSNKSFESQIVVRPNFDSGDYLYAKVNLLNSRIMEGDSVFLKNIGIKNPKNIGAIEIEPIIDIYKFIDNKAENFELIKLMAEDGDIQKIVKDEITSKNYPLHAITISTSKKIKDKEFIEPILNFLNKSEYYSKMQQVYVNNLAIKTSQNDSIINQIDNFLNNFKKSNNSNARSSSLVYYNDNMQLNDIIKTKESLLTEQGNNRVDGINIDKVIKDISISTNIKEVSGLNNKLKFVLPMLFVLFFFLVSLVLLFFRVQNNKRKSLHT